MFLSDYEIANRFIQITKKIGTFVFSKNQFRLITHRKRIDDNSLLSRINPLIRGEGIIIVRLYEFGDGETGYLCLTEKTLRDTKIIKTLELCKIKFRENKK